MDLPEIIHIDDIEIAVAEISDATVAACVASHPTLLLAVEGIRSQRRRNEVIATCALVRHLFGNDAHLSHLPSGAPQLLVAGKDSGTALSISHCEGMVAVAWRKGSAIGIDIETPSPRVMRVAPRFLSAEELHSCHNDLYLTTAAWTVKEALFKCIDEEGVDFAKDLQVDIRAIIPGKECRYRARAYGREYVVATMPIANKILSIILKQST